MQTNDDRRKAAAIAAMAETMVSGNGALSAAGLSLYLRLLEPYSAETVEQAVWGLMRTEKFRPAPADIIAAIEGSPDDKSLRAWHEALYMLAEHGPYHSVQFPDAGIHFAIERMGGWSNWGQWDVDDRPFREKEFRELYAAYRPNVDLVPKVLVGRSNNSNDVAGLPEFVEAPRLAGERRRLVPVLSPAPEAGDETATPEDLRRGLEQIGRMSR